MCTSGSSKNGIVPKVKIDWSSGGENNAKILYYVLQYNTSFTPNEYIDVKVTAQKEVSASVENKTDDEITRLTLVRKFETYLTEKIPGTQSDLTIPLSCWANYTFRIKAVNRLGESDPSEISAIPCYTNPCRPSKQPIGVRSFGNTSNNLIINWNLMPKIEWNAPLFWYQVEYRRVRKENETNFYPQENEFIRLKVPSDRDYVVIENVPTYTEYEFYVKAYNQQAGDGISGEATEMATLYHGFSGEDKPTVIPKNFKLDRTIDARTAKFTWDPISEQEADGMRGKLTGFIIQFYKADGSISGNGMPDLISHKVDGNVTEAIISNLPPYSAVTLKIAVLNGRYQGDYSSPISIYTLEGVPGPVANLRGRPYGSSGVKLQWDEPEEPNGVITGYEIQFQQMANIADSPGLIQPPIVIRNRYELSRIVTGLLPNKKYRFTVLATTSKGVSLDPNFVEVITSSAEKPPKTSFQVLSTLDDGFNITWTTSDQINAASLFYIKYKKTDDLINQAAPYMRTPLTTDNFYFLNELERGTKYSVILVATTGTENVKLETESDPVILKTTGQARASRNVATEPWFIGMMVAIALLLIILINVCVLVRERGGKYSVQEKEPFQNQMLSPDGGFDEYQKSGDGAGNPPIVSGSSNVYFDERQFHDEDDSMAEYGNGENGKFNEDGSFIGLYGRDRVQTYVVQYNQTPQATANSGGAGNANGNGSAPSTSADGSKPYSTFV